MLDYCSISAENEKQMRLTGSSLAQTLYRTPGTIALRGELGAGKTTFVQGFAEGLGLRQRITSPTFALEQRYGAGVLSHIDLYRLTPEQASQFLRTLDPFPGIRIIEWSERTSESEADIEITITEEKTGRKIVSDFRDIAIPTDNEIEQWKDEVCLPQHIRRHIQKVADVAAIVADALIAQGRIVRRAALRSAALTHDLLRFVDFLSMTGDANYSPSQKERDTWTEMKKTFGTPHEAAAEKFLAEHGLPDIGRIVSTHRGHGRDAVPVTIEQFALSYADKRVAMDKLVTLKERFDDLLIRSGHSKESNVAREWRAEMKRIERLLFPQGVPF